MFPKPPRPEPPRRAVATQVVQQREQSIRRVPDTLIVERSPAPAPQANPSPVPPAGRPAAVPSAEGQPD